MTITLCVTGYQGKTLGPQRCKTFDERGGTIGRAENNDWVLPDPQRFLSGHHATLVVREGRFHLLDTSTNGVLVNDAPSPVGKGNSVELRDGDRLAMGSYQIKVSLAAAAVAEPPHMPAPPVSIPHGVTHIAAPQEANQWLMDLLGPASDALSTGAPPLPPPRPVPAEARPPVTESDHAPAVEGCMPTHAAVESVPSDWDLVEVVATAPSPSSMIDIPPAPTAIEPTSVAPPPPATATASGRAAASSYAPPPQAVVSTEVAALPPGAAVLRAAQILMHAAGMKAAVVTEAQADEVLDNVGKVLHEVVAGVMDLLRARATLKSEFRMSMTMIRRDENNPLKFSVSVDEAMRHLLVKQESGYLGAVEAFEQAFDDIKDHQLAMIAGTRAGYEALLRRFDPQALEEKFERLMRTGIVLPGTKKLRYWELYREIYDEFAKEAEEDSQRLFDKEYARAYEEQLRRLGSSPRPSP